jgi:serine/threonine protein kinase
MQFAVDRALAPHAHGWSTPAHSLADSNDSLPLAPAAAGLPAVPGYELLGMLGRGGMGVVYKARDAGLKRVVAIKQLLLGGNASAQQRERFRAEAEAIARLQHPHIVQVFQFGEYDGQPFFVLEFVPGGSLEQKLADPQPQPPREAARLILLLARALHAAHQAGVVHRDLKPGNILLAPPADEPSLNCAWGLPKVSDFGLAQLRDAEGLQTASGTVMGTPAYMAPEQAEGRVHDIGPAADVWALGVLLYQLLTGRVPFKNDSVPALLLQICRDEPETLGGVPPALAAVVGRCMLKKPEERYASAAELADDLKRFLDGEPVVGPRPPVPRRLRWLGWAGAAALVIVAALAIVWWSGSGGTPPTPAGPATQPAGVGPSREEALTAELSVQVWTTRDASKRGLKVEVEGSGALPLRFGERVQLTARLSRPGYPYLLWIDAEGDVTPLYPWNDNDTGDIDNDLNVPPPVRPAVAEIRSPRREGQGWRAEGKSGLVAAVLLVRREPLRSSAELAGLLAGIKAKWQAVPKPGEQAVMVRGSDGGKDNEAVSVTRGFGKKAGEVNDAVLQLRDRLSDRFEIIRSVSFAQVGDK